MSSELTPKYPILIVDDDEHFLHGFYMKLKSDGITNVEKCQDSGEVMSRLKEKKYSLIYLDIRMPGKPGDELLSEILLKYPDMKITMLTGVNEVDIAVKCMRLGAFNYLVKTDAISKPGK